MLKKLSVFNLAVLVFAVGLVSGFFWGSRLMGSPLIGDEWGFAEIASNVLEGGDFYLVSSEGTPTEVEPLYPLFLVSVFSVFGRCPDAARLIQVVLFALTAVLIFFLAKNLFAQKVAFYAGLLTALFYPLAGYSSRLYRESFFAFFLALLVFCLFRAHADQKKKWFIFSGLILGLLILTNGVVYFLPLFVAFNFLLVYKKRIFRRELITPILFLSLTLILVLVPWLVRSYYSDIKVVGMKGGSIFLARAYIQEDLKGEYKEHLVGQTMGYFFAKKFDPKLDQRKLFAFPPNAVYERIAELTSDGLTQEQIGKTLRKEALKIISKEPHLYLLNSFFYFLSFNNPLLPEPKTFTIYGAQNLFVGTHPELSDFVKACIVLGIRLAWAAFFVLVVYGIIKAMKSDWKKFSWPIVVIVYFNLVYSLLFGIPRYALPVYPLYIIFFVYGFHCFYERFLALRLNTKNNR